MRLRKLFESSKNEVAAIFGRFNPPHKGHRAAWEMASQSPIWYVGTNEGTVGPKDPLPFEVKVEAMKTVWPKVASHIVAETSWLTLASKIYKDHGNVTLLCLTDEDWVTKTIVQYNGKEGAHGFYNFPNIQQKTTPRLSSATALRDAVTNGDRDAFTQAAGVDAETSVAGKPFFDLVAEYLLPYANAPKKVVKKKVAEPVESVAEAPWHSTPQSAMIGINGKKTMAKPASDSASPEKSFAYQGYTIKFMPNKREIYKGANLIDTKEGDYSHPTKLHLAQAHSAVGRLMSSKVRAEDAAGVGIITKQNSTADVNKGTLRKMMKAYHLTDNVTEAPIEMDPAEPMNPMIYGAGSNPAKLKDRMMRASGQLNDLATRAANASPAEWQNIAANFDELTMNIEQIRHAMAELAKRRKRGGIGSRGIDKNIG